VYDALGADYAIEGEFGISVTRSGTGWDEAAFFTVTATQYGQIEWIANPVLVGNIPTSLAVAPAAAAGGETVVITGEHLSTVDEGTASAVKFGGTNATSFAVLSDGVITATVPGTTAGSAPIIVTNADGESASIPFQRTAP